MKYIVSLGPAPEAMGGMASVIDIYQRAGLFERFPVIHLATFVDGAVWRRLLVGVQALLRTVWLLTRCEVAFMHIHVAERTSFLRKSLFVMLARICRLPVVLHVHGAKFDQFYLASRDLKRLYIKFIINSSTVLIALSAYWEAWFKEQFPTTTVLRIFNPIIVPDLPAVAKHSSVISLVYLGRICERKGVYDLIYALSKVIDSGIQCRLVVGGDGDDSKLKALINELQLGAFVSLRGWISGAEKQQVLQEADIFVLPSYHEGLPIAILEAMANALPIVSTTIGGIPDAVTDGEHGFLVAPGAIDHLAASISRLASDAALRAKMGSAARRRVEANFSTTVVIDEVSRVYQRLYGLSGAR